MSGRIEVESDAYRRGVVLGLTLAELGVLLVFVLLLLVGFERFRAQPPADEVSLARSQLAELRAADTRLRELQQAVPGAADTPISDDFVHLVLDAAARLDSGADAAAVLAGLREDSARLAAASRTLQALLGTGADAASVANRLKQLSLTAAGQQQQVGQLRTRVAQQQRELADSEQRLQLRRGQISQLQQRMADAGRGRVLPSCWASPDGAVEYIYAIELTSAGLRVAPLPRSPAAAASARNLPLASLQPATVLSTRAFLEATAPLYNWSRTNNCRFFAVVYDATADHEKRRFKELLLTVEAHFYKLLSSAPAPF